MFKVEKETLETAYKPYDVVSDCYGNVGFVQEVSILDSQPTQNQVSYVVNWLTGDRTKMAWFKHKELRYHCNIFVKIAESSCHPAGRSGKWVIELLGTGGSRKELNESDPDIHVVDHELHE